MLFVCYDVVLVVRVSVLCWLILVCRFALLFGGVLLAACFWFAGW